NEADCFRFARHTPLCRNTCHTLPHTSGTHILLWFVCPGQAFNNRGAILRAFMTLVSLSFWRANHVHPASARRTRHVVVVALRDMSHGFLCSPTQALEPWNATVIRMSRA